MFSYNDILTFFVPRGAASVICDIFLLFEHIHSLKNCHNNGVFYVHCMTFYADVHFYVFY